jgi:hypothetical protein
VDAAREQQHRQGFQETREPEQQQEMSEERQPERAGDGAALEAVRERQAPGRGAPEDVGGRREREERKEKAGDQVCLREGGMSITPPGGEARITGSPRPP